MPTRIKHSALVFDLTQRFQLLAFCGEKKNSLPVYGWIVQAI